MMDWRALVAQVMIVLAIFAILCRVSRRKLYLNFSPRQKRTRRSIPAATTEGLTKTDGPGPRCSRGAARSSRYHRPDESKRPRPGVVFFVVGVVVVWVSSQSRLSSRLMAWFRLAGRVPFGSRPDGRPRQKGTKKSCPYVRTGRPRFAALDSPHSVAAPRVAAQGPSTALYGGTPSFLAASMPLALCAAIPFGVLKGRLALPVTPCMAELNEATWRC